MKRISDNRYVIEKPEDDPRWEQALIHLEEDNPELLRVLLAENRLKEYLDAVVGRAWALNQRLQDSGVGQLEIQEIVMAEVVAPVEDLEHEGRPLTAAERKKMEAFREKYLGEDE